MVKQIYAEWYKAVRRPYFRNMLLVSVLCGGGVAWVLWWLRGASPVPEQVNLPFAVISIVFAMVTGLYLVVMGADLVFSEQYKVNTLKNEVSYGLPRWQSYLSRWAVSLAMMLVLLAALLGSYLLLAALLLGMPSDAVSQEQFQVPAAQAMGVAARTLGSYLLASFPLWVGALSACLCLMFLISNSTFAALSYIGLIMGLPAVLDKPGQYVDPFFARLYQLTLQYPFDLMNHAGLAMQDGAQMARCWGIGLGWTVVFTGIGLAVFQRREIK